MEVRLIKLPNGGILEVELKPEFLLKVRQQFMLAPDQEVTDDHIRMFIWGSVESALKKHEGK